VHNGFLDLGAYDELKLPLSLHICCDPHFARLCFKLPANFGGIKEVNYHFHQYANTTDTDNTYFCMDFQHMVLQDGRCYLFLEVGLVMESLFTLNLEDKNDPFYFNGVCILDCNPSEEYTLSRFGSTQNIPFWKPHGLSKEDRVEECDLGFHLYGSADLKYYKTLRFFNHDEVVGHKTLEKTKKPSFKIKAGIFIQNHCVDYLMEFYFKEGKDVRFVNSDEQSESYIDFIANFEGNGIFIENMMLANDKIFILVNLKVKGRGGDYDFYKTMISFPASNAHFNKLCEVCNLDRNDYWNFQAFSLAVMLTEEC
jgi:hypothetical protein